jgi:hypothetical protein
LLKPPALFESIRTIDPAGEGAGIVIQTCTLDRPGVESSVVIVPDTPLAVALSRPVAVAVSEMVHPLIYPLVKRMLLLRIKKSHADQVKRMMIGTGSFCV